MIPQKYQHHKEVSYLKSNGKACPVCESENIVQGYIETNEAVHQVAMSCYSCKVLWKAIFKLTAFELCD